MALNASAIAASDGPSPAAMARNLVTAWYARWGACEDLSDVPVEPAVLAPWADNLMVFDLIDYGMDFRVGSFCGGLRPILHGNGSGRLLSGLPSPLRQDLRRLLLQASMLREPVAESYNWLMDGHVWICTACAMPIAGRSFQPTQFLVGLFHQPSDVRAKPAVPATYRDWRQARAAVSST